MSNLTGLFCLSALPTYSKRQQITKKGHILSGVAFLFNQAQNCSNRHWQPSSTSRQVASKSPVYQGSATNHPHAQPSSPSPSSRTPPSDCDRCSHDTQTIIFSFARMYQINQQHHISDIHFIILVDIRHIHIKVPLLRFIHNVITAFKSFSSNTSSPLTSPTMGCERLT